MSNTKALPTVENDEFLYLSDQGLLRLNQLPRDPNFPNKNVVWTTDYTVELPIRMKKSGPGSEHPYTLIEAFQETFKKFPHVEALRVKRDKKWVSWTYEKYFNDCRAFAKGLITLGITPYRSVNILGFNAPEWSISFYGSIFGGYLPVGIYTTNGPEACQYVSAHSDAEVVIVENKEHLDKYLKVWDELPLLQYVIVYNDKVPENVPEKYKAKIMTIQQLLEIGSKSTKEDELEERMRKQKPGNCCTIVYTSGTTGPPKGVMLSHDNYTWTSSYFLREYEVHHGNERMVSFLPLSHVAAQILDIVGTILCGATVWFAEPTALQGTLVETLKEAKPTLFMSVPRVWEKIEEKMKTIAAQNGPLKTALANWAKSHGYEALTQESKNLPTSMSYKLSKAVVFNNVKKALGLDESRYYIFGAAPLAVSTRKYFASLGIPLVNMYGMSESSGPQSYSNPHNFDFPGDEPTFWKSAGMKIPGTTMIIYEPDQDGNGEICYKGRNRFMGYYKNDDSTSKTIDNEGYLHSGDVGKLDKKGNLAITGRIKELIITAGGENIAPVLIENEIKDQLKYVSNAMVVGENKKYLVVLLTLKHAVDSTGKIIPNKLSDEAIRFLQEIGSSAKTLEEARKDPVVVKHIETGINKANEKAISRAHSVRKWFVIDGDFAVETGELTPTLKLKRDVTAKKHTALIEKLYEDAKL